MFSMHYTLYWNTKIDSFLILRYDSGYYSTCPIFPGFVNKSVKRTELYIVYTTELYLADYANWIWWNIRFS